MNYFTILTNDKKLITNLETLDPTTSLLISEGQMCVIRTALSIEAVKVVRGVTNIISLKSVIDEVTGD